MRAANASILLSCILVAVPCALIAQGLPDAPSSLATVSTKDQQQKNGTRIDDERSGRSQVTPKSRAPHQFFDRTNILLTVAEVAATSADGAITLDKLNRTRPEVRLVNGIPTVVNVHYYHEMNPIARPFVEAGWPGQIGYEALVVGSDLGIRYVLHRTHHHKAERLFPLILLSGATTGVVYGATH